MSHGLGSQLIHKMQHSLSDIANKKQKGLLFRSTHKSRDFQTLEM